MERGSWQEPLRWAILPPPRPAYLDDPTIFDDPSGELARLASQEGAILAKIERRKWEIQQERERAAQQNGHGRPP